MIKNWISVFLARSSKIQMLCFTLSFAGTVGMQRRKSSTRHQTRRNGERKLPCILVHIFKYKWVRTTIYLYLSIHSCVHVFKNSVPFIWTTVYFSPFPIPSPPRRSLLNFRVRDLNYSTKSGNQLPRLISSRRFAWNVLILPVSLLVDFQSKGFILEAGMAETINFFISSISQALIFAAITWAMHYALKAVAWAPVVHFDVDSFLRAIAWITYPPKAAAFIRMLIFFAARGSHLCLRVSLLRSLLAIVIHSFLFWFIAWQFLI